MIKQHTIRPLGVEKFDHKHWHLFEQENIFILYMQGTI